MLKTTLMKKNSNNYCLPRNLYTAFFDLVPKSKTKPFLIPNVQVFNQYLKRIRTGCQYRELCSYWKDVYYRIKKWKELGFIDELIKLIHRHLRLFESNEYILVLDTQSVPNTKHSLQGGYDSNKKIYGLKRCPFVDIDGNLLDIFVFDANMHERTCLENALKLIYDKGLFKDKVIYIYADKGFFGKEYIKRLSDTFGVRLKIMEIDYHDINKVNKNTKNKWKDLHPIAKKVYDEESEIIRKRNKEKSKIRNVVERYFAWLRDYRLLNMNYERYQESHRVDCMLASIVIMLRKAKGLSKG
jgi:hypothetical protein